MGSKFVWTLVTHYNINRKWNRPWRIWNMDKRISIGRDDGIRVNFNMQRALEGISEILHIYYSLLGKHIPLKKWLFRIRKDILRNMESGIAGILRNTLWFVDISTLIQAMQHKSKGDHFFTLMRIRLTSPLENFFALVHVLEKDWKKSRNSNFFKIMLQEKTEEQVPMQYQELFCYLDDGEWSL